jgi:acyl-CoA synthetase (AMP-forming)/AMP-acid ligase II
MMGMYMTQALHRMGQRNAGRTAAVDAHERLDWEALADRVARVAGGLRSLGLAPGDRVAMLSRNSVDYFAYIFGTWWAGGVINPVNLRWTADEMAYSLQDCQSRILIVEQPFAAMIPALRAEAPCLEHVFVIGGIGDDVRDWRAFVARSEPIEDSLRAGSDLAAILYTGGTTGRPKGVMLSHGNLAGSVFGMLAVTNSLADSHYLHSAPLFHIGALSGLFATLYSDATHYFLPAFDPLSVLEAIHRERIDDLFLVPTMLRMLLDHPRFGEFDTGCVRRIRYGASPIDGALMDRAIAAFPHAGFQQAYGLTEADHGAEGRASGRLRSAGRATATTEVRIVDAQDKEAPRGAIGEIVVRGPGVMLGYWNKPEATAEALRGGWMHTGDLGVMDAEGYVTVVDRLKDMIITGGENVYSAEVESALSTHPDVGQAAVIAAPDEKWGERVHAVIVPKPGVDPCADRLAAHCRQTLAGFKVPRSFEFVEALPLSGAGKVLKNELRARLSNQRGQG